MATVDEIRRMQAFCDEKHPDQICKCNMVDCGECDRRTLLAEIDALNLLVEASAKPPTI